MSQINTRTPLSEINLFQISKLVIWVHTQVFDLLGQQIFITSLENCCMYTHALLKYKSILSSKKIKTKIFLTPTYK